MKHWETTSILSTKRLLPFFRTMRSLLIAIGVGGGIGIVGYLIHLKRKCRSSTLGDWVKVAIVEKLFIYPVKSMKGIEVILTVTSTVQVDQMDCTRIGPCNGDVKDRHFMVMDKDSGKLITGRQFPLLVTFTAHIEVQFHLQFWCVNNFFYKISSSILICNIEENNRKISSSILMYNVEDLQNDSIVLHNKNSTVQISLAQIIEANQIHRIEYIHYL